MKKQRINKKMMFEKKTRIQAFPPREPKKKQEKTEQNANFRNFKLTKKHFFYN